MKTSNAAFSSAEIISGASGIRLKTFDQFKQETNTYARVTDSTSYLPNVFPTGESFFYVLENLSNSSLNQELNSIEYGVAKLNKKQNKYYLERQQVFEFSINGFSKKVDKDFFPSYSPDNYLLIRSVFPPSYLDLYYQPNSVVFSSSGDGSLESVSLTNNTVFGMKDGKIGAINSTDLQEIIGTEIVDTISNNSSTLNLTTEEINLTNNDSKIAAPMFQVKPVYTNSYRPANPQRGMIIFNSDENVFEGYDGSSWRQFNWT